MNYRFILVAIIILLFTSNVNLNAQLDLPILPKPREVVSTGDYAKLNKNFNIYIDSKSELDKQYVSSIFYELGFNTYFTGKENANLVISIDKKASDNVEGYILKIQDKSKNQIKVSAPTKSGALYAIQTLRQIIKTTNGVFSVPECTIKDEPAFPWRAYMQDESRHFQGMTTVKLLLDEMARLKMNTFHWHLVDDQGWRIEIKQYPKLTEVGSKRDFSDGGLTAAQWDEKYPGRKMYYTQDDIKEIISYADNRGIRIIPEIEVPGHASASIFAYPWLGATSSKEGIGLWGDLYNVTDPKVEEFIRNVLDEVVALFPSKIVHIGGDEANYTHWQNNPQIVEFMKANNIPTHSDLQVWSINRFSKYLASKGSRMIGWNEITGDNIRGEAHIQASQSESLAPGTIVQFWDGDISLVNKAIEKGYDVVNSNRLFTYLDYPYSSISFEKAYSFNPIPEGLKKEDENKIFGTGCQMWGEYTPTKDRLYFQIFPRLAAYAECGWTQHKDKNYTDFRKRYNTTIEPIWKEKDYLKLQDY
ncbi:MAG: beta-N-acetylhexosaminidase [Dysgonamonadaceae bacterium]